MCSCCCLPLLSILSAAFTQPGAHLVAEPCTGSKINPCTWFGEIHSCCCYTVLSSARLGLGELTLTSAPEEKLFKSHDKAPERGEDRFDISPFIFGSLFIRFAGDALPSCFSPGRTEITSPGPRPSSPFTSHNF